ncbi:TonB-dependent receptor domain-containing protein [Myxococcus sp. 1LA]
MLFWRGGNARMEGKKAPRLVGALLATLLASAAAANPGSTVLGTVTDAQSGLPIADVVVTASTGASAEERIVVTRPDGGYRLADLPPGGYTLRFEREHFEPHAVSLSVREGHALRANVALQPTVPGEYVDLSCGPSTVNTLSSTLRFTRWRSDVSRLPVSRPSTWAGAMRTVDSLAEWAPGTVDGIDGRSFSGASPFENEYLLDGLSTRDPTTGRNLLPLSQELLSGMEVLTGGYMPEYGRSTGGIVDVKTTPLTSELYGEVFANWAPGALEGTWAPAVGAPRPPFSSSGALHHLGDFGGVLGGPLMKDRLWFFAGIVPALSRVEQDTGFMDQRGLQALARLTYAITHRHWLSLSVVTAPSLMRGTDEARAPWEVDSDTVMTALNYSATVLDGLVALDAKASWLGHAVTRVESGAPARLGTDRFQAKTLATYRPRALGYHVLTAGLELDHVVQALPSSAGLTSSLMSGFVQDSWTLNSRVTLNGGLRYDAQFLDAGVRGDMAHQQLSPRLGLVVDPGGNGRMKLFAHAAKYQGMVPLGLLGPDVRLASRLAPTSSTELIVGAEHELSSLAKAGVTYTRRRLDDALALFADEGTDGFVVVNPETGSASGLPKAARTYDAVTVELGRSFWDGWQAQLFYTWSRLRGNYTGPFSADAGRPLEQTRLLPADRPHVFKAYGSKEFTLTRKLRLNAGLSYLGAAGMPRDSNAARTPWVHTIDAHLSARYGVPDQQMVTLSLDAFNLLNAQAVLREDTFASAQYQAPRQLRLGLRYSF